MAPGRKADPGRKFDWRRLALGGRAVWAEALAEDAGWEAFGGAAAAAGYAGEPAAVLEAFRLRFRPWVAAGGAPDRADVGTALALGLALTAGDGGAS